MALQVWIKVDPYSYTRRGKLVRVPRGTRAVVLTPNEEKCVETARMDAMMDGATDVEARRAGSAKAHDLAQKRFARGRDVTSVEFPGGMDAVLTGQLGKTRGQEDRTSSRAREKAVPRRRMKSGVNETKRRRK